MKLAQVQKHLNQIHCPACQSQKSMLAVLRCDLGVGPCLISVTCQDCRGTFEAGEVLKEQVQASNDEYYVEAA